MVHSPDLAAIGRVITLSRHDSLALGRGTENPHGLLVDTRLSRAHAMVAFDANAGQFRVTDSGSRNGTFVHGRRIESALLDPDSVIRLGGSVLVFAESDRMKQLLERADRVADGTLSLLLLGETGTGKELLARRIHERSGRSGPFVAVNCAALPREMIAAELFGHLRGAFSGAVRERAGLFRSAQGGTLLLDEIGDMPLDLQPALLRVLQEKKVRPVGSDQEAPVDVRVLAATHNDLAEKAKAGDFRADLWARLAQMTLTIPPLRARRAELLALARTLSEAHQRKLMLSAESAEALLLWSWPLNFRELESLLALYAATATAGQPLDLEFLRGAKPELVEALTDPGPGGNAEAAGSASEDSASQESLVVDEAGLRRALGEARGNLAVAARSLGISRQKLYRWLSQAGLDADSFRRTFRGGAPSE